MAATGIGLGGVASVLAVWGVLWAQIPTLPAPPQVALAGLQGERFVQAPYNLAPLLAEQSDAGTALSPATEALVDEHSMTLTRERPVAPVAQAKIVEPEYQLHVNLIAVAYEICVSLTEYRAAVGVLPDSLLVAADGTLTAAGATMPTVLPAYMRLGFAPAAAEGSAFVTVADAQSGLAVACVQSGDQMWIENS